MERQEVTAPPPLPGGPGATSGPAAGADLQPPFTPGATPAPRGRKALALGGIFTAAAATGVVAFVVAKSFTGAPRSASAGGPLPGSAPDAPFVREADKAVDAAREAARSEATGTTLYARTSPGVVRIEVRDANFKVIAHGSGFFVSEDGLVVTNHHVIEGAHFAAVECGDGTTLFVEGIAAANKEQDVAVLKVKAEKLPCLELGPAERPAVGTKVYAVGHPLGLRNSVLSEGIVSGVGDPVGAGGVQPIQTTAPISPGSSGGPLVTVDGKVVGITSGALRPDVSQNLNVAMPVSLVHELMKKASAASAGGELKTLASAGGRSLDRTSAAAMQKVWSSIDRGDLRTAALLVTEQREKLKDSLTYWMTAGVLHLQLKNYANAEEAFRNATRIKPDAVASHGGLAVALLMQEKPKEAIKAFEAAAKLSPKDPKYYAAAGSCYLQMKQPDNAVKFFKHAIRLSPNDADHHRGLGYCYAMMNQYADAMMSHKQAVKLRPNDAEAHVALADAYHGLKRADEALDSFKRAVTLKPRHARAHVMIGVLHLEANRTADAISSWRTAARVDPNGEIGQKAAAAAADLDAGIKNRELMEWAKKLQEKQAQQQAQQQKARPTPVRR